MGLLAHISHLFVHALEHLIFFSPDCVQHFRQMQEELKAQGVLLAHAPSGFIPPPVTNHLSAPRGGRCQVFSKQASPRTPASLPPSDVPTSPTCCVGRLLCSVRVCVFGSELCRAPPSTGPPQQGFLKFYVQPQPSVLVSWGNFTFEQRFPILTLLFSLISRYCPNRGAHSPVFRR